MKKKLIIINILFLLLSHTITTTVHCADQARIDPDYSISDNWITLPASIDKSIDVFWVYPTVYTGKAPVASINDPQMRDGAQLTLRTQAAVFKDSANIFAPLYRQANMSILGQDNLHKDQYLNVGKSDVRAAFNHYLRELNNGRPFILASHSQGSVIVTALMKELMDNPNLRDKMVAAYAIGWGITQDDLNNFTFLKICEKADQTGCIVTYNCVADGYQKAAPTILPGTIVVNPLDWTTNSEKVSADQNKGAVFFNKDGIKSETIPNYCSSEIKDGGLVVDMKNTAPMKRMPFGKGVYHVYDYSLFFDNLKANVAERIKAYQKDHK
ncbi:DUF3089 domain-containing protein [Maridesulfovibrio ferrireducens]|uniref:DUF3089 domain-containing protein n=1 Tax=Maridesulfovibrio ferrireducens TaxID=246191 RepID=UPI001A356383|nr:DUF3089 domain-containing protein [Maridesulfovibrio ferrireducens]MBI9111880.1 DUF3089 domain-containing protein [Maridesulfovibrio ferrireducens]